MDKSSGLDLYRKYLFFITLTVFSHCLFAAEEQSVEVALSPIAELSTVKLHQDEWHSVIPSPASNEKYFLASQSGKIYTLNNGHISNASLLDLKIALESPDMIALTAITLDPSFNYSDRKGFNTFYTAHVEPRSNHTQDNSYIINKLNKSATTSTLPYDAVVMRWQLSEDLKHGNKITTKHEVIRIAIHHKDEAIKQISFNPYIESWHDDFGLLYILMAYSKTVEVLKQPIYSGAILRIKPERFGLQTYTIPIDNPFIKNTKIRNEIAVVVGEAIVNFDWIKNGENSLLLQLEKSQKHPFIKIKLGDDLRQASSDIQYSKHIANMATSSNSIFYRGRELKSLWGKILQLKQDKGDWYLQAIKLDATMQQVAHSSHNLSQATALSKLSLHKNHNSELLLIEHNQQLLYALKAAKAPIQEPSTSRAPVAIEKSNNTTVIVLIIMMLLSAYFWYLRKSLQQKQHFLYQQWANFDVNPATKSLSLYQRHNQTVAEIIKIPSLKSSEILLNDEVISVVSADNKQNFSNAVEEHLVTVFAKEHRLKMFNDKQRKIQLRLTDENNTIYLFCLYYRIGNMRHTKLKYSKVINKIIDWHWLFSQVVNSENTEKRKIRVKQKPERSDTLLRSNASQSNNANAQKRQNVSKTTANEKQYQKEIIPPVQVNHDVSINQDSELVFALDKLVEMKKQGYLNEHEFNTAKAKILKDLVNE